MEEEALWRGRSIRVLLGRAGWEPRIPASLTITGDGFLARPESHLEPSRQAVPQQTSEHSWFIDLGNPRHEVEDFLPRALWGLNNGEPFTLLDAKMTVDREDLSQTYQGRQILRGVHVSNDQVPIVGLRVAFPFAEPCGWMRQQEPVGTPQGVLAPWQAGAQPGLQWRPHAAHPLRDMAFRRGHSIATLLSLWIGRQLRVSRLEIEIPNDGWHPVELVSTHPHDDKLFTDLLPLSDVTLEVFSRWLDELATLLGPVPHIAVRKREAEQIEALIVAAGLEGLHRRLYPKSRMDEHQRLAGVSEPKLKKARRAAVKAALSELSDAPQASDVFREALAHVDELSFREKMHELSSQVDQVAPGLLGPDLKAWAGELAGVRNVQAHLLKKHDDFGETEISQYYVLGSSGRWALRILLLLQVATAEQISKALRQSTTFAHALANIDREKYWDDFSAYERFYASA